MDEGPERLKNTILPHHHLLISMLWSTNQERTKRTRNKPVVFVLVALSSVHHICPVESCLRNHLQSRRSGLISPPWFSFLVHHQLKAAWWLFSAVYFRMSFTVFAHTTEKKKTKGKKREKKKNEKNTHTLTHTKYKNTKSCKRNPIPSPPIMDMLVILHTPIATTPSAPSPRSIQHQN